MLNLRGDHRRNYVLFAHHRSKPVSNVKRWSISHGSRPLVGIRSFFSISMHDANCPWVQKHTGAFLEYIKFDHGVSKYIPHAWLLLVFPRNMGMHPASIPCFYQLPVSIFAHFMKLRRVFFLLISREVFYGDFSHYHNSFTQSFFYSQFLEVFLGDFSHYLM